MATAHQRQVADLIYKIVSADDWRCAKKSGCFRGSSIDRKDGFIHFSTADQVSETLARHFQGQRNLRLVAVDGTALGDRLKWEPSRGGDSFPHLYDSLSLEHVLSVTVIQDLTDGGHRIQ